jgi:ubiquinone/menaquinone biosynthesis C-methylase UbiE
MTASILWIDPGADFARRVYDREGRGEWAQALPLVLEKLGYLGLETAPPPALADPRTWRRHAAILVPSLPAGGWSAAAIALAGSGRAQLLAELPPRELGERIGVLAAEPGARDGVVSPHDAELTAAVAAASTVSNAYLQPPRSRPVDRAEGLGWAELDVPIGAEQAERWRAPGWRSERWSLAAETEVLAVWRDAGGGEEARPALVRRGSLLAASFSLFGFLGQQTTIQPFAGAEHLIWSRPFALEAMLAALLDDMHRRARVSRPRIMPWPEGAEWALNVRHDFDRAQSRGQVARVLAAHAEAGTAATWYWRARHVEGSHSAADRLRARGSDGAAVARMVAAAPRQEVALHTELLWASAEAERRRLERATGRRALGTSAHGDPECFRWQGAPNVLWAERHGFAYTEFISHSHLHPHRFAALRDDGTVEPSRIVCLPHHESLDRSTKPGDANVDGVLAAAESYRRSGGLMQVLNHPDLNLEELSEVLRRLPRDGRLDWTAADAAEWWRRTHAPAELRLEQEPAEGAVTLTSARGVRGAVLELLDPDGTRRRYSLQIEAGGSVTVGGPRARGSVRAAGDDGAASANGGLAVANGAATRWREVIAPAFVRAARAYYEDSGLDPASAEAECTLATNSELVPARVDAIRRYLRELGGVDSLGGARVLDCGAGFGAFAAYLSLGHDRPLVTAVEVRSEFAALAGHVASQAGLGDAVAYEVGDMRSLDAIADASFDVVVVNNSFIYLTSKSDMERAVAELRRVTVPGGHVCFFHANSWQVREPFTRDPLVHLLPAALAERVSSLTGWRHNHGRVRLLSAPALRRMLRRGGFERVAVGAVHRGHVARPPRAYVGRFYAAVARREAEPNGGARG